jgi:hypothetical protein
MRTFINNYKLSAKERAVYKKTTATISYVATKNKNNDEIELITFMDDEEIFYHIFETEIVAVNNRMPDDNVPKICNKMIYAYMVDLASGQYDSGRLIYEAPMFGCLCDECKSKLFTSN